MGSHHRARLRYQFQDRRSGLPAMKVRSRSYAIWTLSLYNSVRDLGAMRARFSMLDHSRTLAGPRQLFWCASQRQHPLQELTWRRRHMPDRGRGTSVRSDKTWHGLEIVGLAHLYS